MGIQIVPNIILYKQGTRLCLSPVAMCDILQGTGPDTLVSMEKCKKHNIEWQEQRTEENG